MTKQVGYLGPPGSFGEQAALHHDTTATLVALPSHIAVVQAVLEGAVDEGVAAVENSLEGAVSETLDALLKSEGVFITREIILQIVQNLIAAPDTALSDIRVVMSHPIALAQCRAFLERQLPGARIEAALSTAAAVEAAVQRRDTAAIGTSRAAQLAGGRILAEGVQDIASNKTRFVVLSRSDAAPTGDDKTSIAFTVAHDRPGSLLGVLQELASRGINMTRVESRPTREELGIYIFLIDFQGHRAEAPSAAVLAAVEAKSHYFRLLGSYPRDK